MISKYVRLATKEDIPVLLRFARNFLHASPYKTMKFDVVKGRQFLEQAVEGFGFDRVVLVALNDGEPIGMLVGAASEPVFSNTKVAMELGWWIEEESRHTRASFLLYKAYEDWAERVGCSHVQGAYLPGISPDLDEFYKKLGYKQVETSYLKVLTI